MDKPKKTSKATRITRYLGIIFILSALLMNPLFIGRFFAAGRNIATPAYITIIIMAEIFALAVGLAFFLKPRYYREYILFLVSLALCLLLVEAISRVYLCNFADYSLQSKFLLYGQCNIKSLYSPHQYLNYHGTPNYVSPDGLNIHNSYGFRGPEIQVPKPNSTYRIVTIGGSTTYTVDVKDWRKDFARQLQKELQKRYNYSNIEVINAGLSSWDSWENLINLEFQVLDLEPDMLVIYPCVNDVHARMVNPIYYRGDNSGRRKQWSPSPIPLFLHSTFIRLVTGINPSGIGQFVDSPHSLAGISETGFVEELNGTPLETIQKNKPIYFERNLRSMLAIAKENDISVMMATWAYEARPGDFSSTPAYKLGLEQNKEIVIRLGKTHDVPVYDFAAEMPMNKTYSNDGKHVNEKGAELKGKLFAKYIQSNRLIDRRIAELRNLNQ